MGSITECAGEPRPHDVLRPIWAVYPHTRGVVLLGYSGEFPHAVPVRDQRTSRNLAGGSWTVSFSASGC